MKIVVVFQSSSIQWKCCFNMTLVVDENIFYDNISHVRQGICNLKKIQAAQKMRIYQLDSSLFTLFAKAGLVSHHNGVK